MILEGIRYEHTGFDSLSCYAAIRPMQLRKWSSRRIRNVCPLYFRKWSQRVELRPGCAHDVFNRVAARRERIRNERAVAAPRYSLGAHNRDRFTFCGLN